MPRVGSAVVARVVEVDSVEEAAGLEVVVKAAALEAPRDRPETFTRILHNDQSIET